MLQITKISGIANAKKPGRSKANLREEAFTLIEMLISITVFMLFLGIVAGSYTSLVKANRTANESQQLYREVRFVFDSIAQEMRSGSIDYSCVAAGQTEILCIRNKNFTERSIYKFSRQEKKILMMSQSRTADGAAVDAPWGAEADWQPLTSEKLAVDDAGFTVAPSLNPYDAANAYNDDVQFQPTVTIILKTRGYDFRATYTSRTYGTHALY